MLNHDFLELIYKERIYRKNKKKKILKRVILIFLSIIVMFLAFLVAKEKFKKKDFQNELNITKTTKIIQSKQVVYEPVHQTVEKVDQNLTSIKVQNSIQKPDLKPEVKKVLKVTKKIQKSDQEKIKKPKIKMVVVENDNLEKLLDEDMSNAKFSTSIDIARYYFNKKNYDEAIIWAIKASKQNRNSVKPWIIYAKSKYQLGNKKIAIKSLEIYLKKHNSTQARNLLDRFKSK